MDAGAKPFRSADDQIELLESRGIVFGDKTRAAQFLLRENYYAVVNGYKDAFIDKQATNIAGEDRYREGTTIESLMFVYLFDRMLRNVTMSVLLEAETTLKTSVVYAFCSVHRGVEDYLDPACYCGKAEYRQPEQYTKGIIRLLSMLQAIRENRQHKQYVRHYVRQHRCLPLWVAAKCITFGGTSALFDFQQQSVKTRVCISLARALDRKVVKQKDVAYALHTLPEFRNVCAHDERLYCAKVDKRNDKGFAELLRALRTSIPEDRYDSYVQQVIKLLAWAKQRSPQLELTVLSGMGMSKDQLHSELQSARRV